MFHGLERCFCSKEHFCSSSGPRLYSQDLHRCSQPPTIPVPTDRMYFSHLYKNCLHVVHRLHLGEHPYMSINLWNIAWLHLPQIQNSSEIFSPSIFFFFEKTRPTERETLSQKITTKQSCIDLLRGKMDTHVEIRGQLAGLSHLIPLCGFQGLNSGHETRKQCPLST